jgi:copper ion binding protein
MQETLSYSVGGMSCEHCRRAVHDAVAGLDGVTAVVVDLDTGRVDVSGDAIDDDTVRAAIDDAGYEAA